MRPRVRVRWFSSPLSSRACARSESSRSATSLSRRTAFSEGWRSTPELPMPRMNTSTTNIGGNHFARCRSASSGIGTCTLGFAEPVLPMCFDSCRNLLARKPGADAAGVDPAVLRVRPRQQQRAEARARSLARRRADDRELVALQALGLAPVVAAARRVGPVRALGDDAFEFLLRGQRERRRAFVAGDVRAVGQVRDRRLQQVFEQRLALDQRRLADVDAIDVQQVEQHVGQRALLARPTASPAAG